MKLKNNILQDTMEKITIVSALTDLVEKVKKIHNEEIKQNLEKVVNKETTEKLQELS